MVDQYQVYLYLGIAFFIIHILINGFTLNLSYFGLVLIYIGYFKPILSPLVKKILWVLIALDIFANFRKIYDIFVIQSPKKELKKESKKEKKESKKQKE
jgi:uncharacterized metal-binding protein